MRQRLKRWWYGLLGKDPEGVVVACDDDLLEEMRRLVPGRRVLRYGAQSLRPYRVAQVAVRMGRDRGMLWRALRLGPVLAFHPNGEWHQLSWRCPVASVLFVLGVPLPVRMKSQYRPQP